MTDDTPQWSLLPHDPKAFFGLEDGFDRRDLKRSYNKLLRRFRPEKFPDEFRRIREAYEQLEGTLRTGSSITSLRRMTEEWREATQSNTPSTPITNPGNARPVKAWAFHQDVVTRLENARPRAVYSELATRPRGPNDYLALAVLSDVLDEVHASRFFFWVCEGLRHHPRDRQLTAVLVAWFQTEEAHEDLAQTLTAIADVVRDASFYRVTLSLWKAAAVQLPFAEFTELLSLCAAQIGDTDWIDDSFGDAASEVLMHMAILRRLALTADKDWLDAEFDLVRDHAMQVPDHLRSQLDFLWNLRAYRGTRHTFRAGHPIRLQIDECIEAYGQKSDGAYDQIRECQSRFAESDIGLQAFSIDESKQLRPARLLWELLTSVANVGPYRTVERAQPDQQAWKALTERLKRETRRRPGVFCLGALRWLTRHLGLVLGAISAIALLAAMFEWLWNHPLVLVGSGMAVVWAIQELQSIWSRIWGRLCGPLLSKLAHVTAGSHYKSRWRGEIHRYLIDQKSDVPTLLKRLKEWDHAPGWMSGMIDMLRDDHGLAIATMLHHEESEE